eukprot:TRINITY_DN1539_c0_g1_i1.p1 TRINITY_DN1539_c0_g1~~TRINITY_DN1539_c0_g1_i1.p1  ORF type:complete len:71 (-),score=4.00 TRINITY_DN1539_c0_g1_i1:165-377(-)
MIRLDLWCQRLELPKEYYKNCNEEEYDLIAIELLKDTQMAEFFTKVKIRINDDQEKIRIISMIKIQIPRR